MRCIDPRAIVPPGERTHALVSNNLPRVIHRLESVSSVVSCAVFFFSPQQRSLKVDVKVVAA